MLVSSADYHLLKCAAVDCDNSTFQTKSEEFPHIARRVLQGEKICRLKEVPVALSHSETQKRAFTLIFARRRIVITS